MYSWIRQGASAFKVFLVLLLILPCCAYADDTTAKEIKVGSEAAKDIERQIELADDPNIQSRINAIGQKLATVANVTPVIATYGSSDVCKFDYVFKLVDEKEVNAFALPAGFVYVNKGLVDYVKNDDELAAVLSHEIAHVAHHHSMKLMKKQSKMDIYLAAITLLGAMGNLPARDMTNLVYGAQLVKASKMGGYGQTAELDADRTSITYLHKAGYDPNAMIRFMQRMSRDAQEKPQLPLGIFRTHPHFPQRVDGIVAEMDRLGIKHETVGSQLNRTAIVQPTKVGEKLMTEVSIAGKVVYRPADTAGSTSAQRAAAIAADLNTCLSSAKTLSHTRISYDETCVRLNGKTVITVLAEDVALHQTTADQLVRQVTDTIRFAIWCDYVAKIRAT